MPVLLSDVAVEIGVEGDSCPTEKTAGVGGGFRSWGFAQAAGVTRIRLGRNVYGPAGILQGGPIRTAHCVGPGSVAAVEAAGGLRADVIAAQTRFRRNSDIGAPTVRAAIFTSSDSVIPRVLSNPGFPVEGVEAVTERGYRADGYLSALVIRPVYRLPYSSISWPRPTWRSYRRSQVSWH